MEWPSAVAQWRRLPPQERRAGDSVVEDTITFLERRGAKPDETYDVAVALAVRLGLERIHQVDEHASDGPFADEDPGAGPAAQAAWKVGPSRAVAEEQAMEATLTTRADVLEVCRFLNRPRTQRQDIKADFGANLTLSDVAGDADRHPAAWRGLRIPIPLGARAVGGRLARRPQGPHGLSGAHRGGLGPSAHPLPAGHQFETPARGAGRHPDPETERRRAGLIRYPDAWGYVSEFNHDVAEESFYVEPNAHRLGAFSSAFVLQVSRALAARVQEGAARAVGRSGL